MSVIVYAKFDQNPLVRMAQHEQFLREEADAMRQAGGYAAACARRLFADERAFRGALDEDASTPIDHPGGPKQTLLVMTLDFMREDGGNSPCSSVAGW